MRNKRFPAQLTVAIVVFLLASFSYHYFSTAGFLYSHLRDAELLNAGKKLTGHFGSPLLVVGTHRLTGFSIRECYNLILSLHVILTFLALYHVLFRLSSEKKPHFTALIACAFALMIAAPIGLPYLAPEIYNFTRMNRSIALWRNTTHTIVQPYVIIAFGYACLFIQEFLTSTQPRLSKIWIAGISLFISSLMKPSFAYSFIPALGIFSLIKYRQKPRLLMILALIAMPSGLLLLVQGYLFFIGNPLNSTLSIAIDPFMVWIRNNEDPVLALLLSMVFPLYIMIMRGEYMRLPMQLALCNFVVACVPYAIFSGTGDRDFEWSYWYGLQLLFLTSTLELLRWKNEKNGDSTKEFTLLLVGAVLLLLHTAFGVARFIIHWP